MWQSTIAAHSNSLRLLCSENPQNLTYSGSYAQSSLRLSELKFSFRYPSGCNNYQLDQTISKAWCKPNLVLTEQLWNYDEDIMNKELIWKHLTVNMDHPSPGYLGIPPRICYAQDLIHKSLWGSLNSIRHSNGCDNNPNDFHIHIGN